MKRRSNGSINGSPQKKANKSVDYTGQQFLQTEVRRSNRVSIINEEDQEDL